MWPWVNRWRVADTVVGQGEGRQAVGGGGGGETGDDVRAGHAVIGGAIQQVLGVVVEPVEDLGISAISQSPMREIGLPALVGLIGGKANVGAFRAFAWLRIDQAVMAQDAADGRRRGYRQSLPGQMPLQGDGAGVESFGGERFAQHHDRGDDLIGHRARVAGGSPRPRVDGLQTALPVAVDQSINVLPRHPIRPGCSAY